MAGMTRQEVEDVVDLAVTKTTAVILDRIDTKFKEYQEVERNFHSDKAETRIELLTGMKPAGYHRLRDSLEFLYSFKRNFSRIAVVVSTSFIGLVLKSFWQDISGLFK